MAGRLQYPCSGHALCHRRLPSSWQPACCWPTDRLANYPPNRLTRRCIHAYIYTHLSRRSEPEQPEQEYRHRPRGYSTHKVGIEPSAALVLFGLTDAITWIDAMPYNIPSFSSLGCPLHHPSVRPPAPATSRPPSAATCRMPHSICNSYSSLFFFSPWCRCTSIKWQW